MIRTLVVDDDPVAADAHTMYVQRVPGFVSPRAPRRAPTRCAGSPTPRWKAAVSFGATQYLVKPFTAGAVRAKLEAFRVYRERLGEEVVLAQGDVDALLDTLRGPGEDVLTLPKGVSRESLAAAAAVLQAGAPGSGRTAAEVATALGASRVTARRYLEHLVVSGLAEREARYGDTGRPQTEYHWRPRLRGHGR